jgi:hypothetical protein
MDKTAKQPFSELLSAHESDYKSLFGRVTSTWARLREEVASLLRSTSVSSAMPKARPIRASRRSSSSSDAIF